MKKIIAGLFLVAGLCVNSHAFNTLSYTQGFSSAITVSTTPTVFVSSTTLLDIQEVVMWNYAASSIYVNFVDPVSSTTAAATGIQLFQATTNDNFIDVMMDKKLPIYFTLGAASGTSTIRVLQLGKKIGLWF